MSDETGDLTPATALDTLTRAARVVLTALWEDRPDRSDAWRAAAHEATYSVIWSASPEQVDAAYGDLRAIAHGLGAPPGTPLGVDAAIAGLLISHVDDAQPGELRHALVAFLLARPGGIGVDARDLATPADLEGHDWT